MQEYTESSPKVSTPEENHLSVKLFNEATSNWEYMQLTLRRDYIGGKGYVYSYQRVGSDKCMKAESFDTCRRLGLIKVLSDREARVLWIGPQSAAA